ncbi:MAG: hypothetical protein ACI9DC_004592 [Gammaproteobacteria bacterium]|jgi:hypothetical protein
MTVTNGPLVVLASTLLFAVSLSSSALETIFEQNFEAGLGVNESIEVDFGETSIETRYVTCSTDTSQCPFSETRSVTDPTEVRNFDVHHQDTN